MKKLLAGLGIGLMAALATAATATDGGEPGLAEFMRVVRQPRLANSRAAMSGDVSHVRKGGGAAERHVIGFTMTFAPRRLRAQLSLDAESGYLVAQEYGARGAETTVVRNHGDNDVLLEKLGIRPAELTLGFLHWPYTREEERTTLRTVACRVVQLQDPATGEVARVYLSRDYFFPLKAEFYAPGEPGPTAPGSKPTRTLEITGFKKIGNYYTVTEFAILARDFRTRIDFRDIRLSDGAADNSDNNKAK